MRRFWQSSSSARSAESLNEAWSHCRPTAAFPFCCWMLRGRRVLAVTVAAIREETDVEINDRAAVDEKITVHWLSLGELSRAD